MKKHWAMISEDPLQLVTCYPNSRVKNELQPRTQRNLPYENKKMAAVHFTTIPCEPLEPIKYKEKHIFAIFVLVLSNSIYVS